MSQRHPTSKNPRASKPAHRAVQTKSAKSTTIARRMTAPAAGTKRNAAVAFLTTDRAVGLCSTCNNAMDCAYRARRGFDAMFCEMFDNYGPSPNGGKARQSAHLVQQAPQRAAKPAELSAGKGLCATCENRDGCAYPRPEGGIWHCEEFR